MAGAIDVEKKGLNGDGVWDRVPGPNYKLVVGSNVLFNRKINKHGDVDKYGSCVVAEGFWQMKRLQVTDSFAPTPAVASTRAMLVTATVEDRELPGPGTEHAFIQAEMDETIHIELPEEYLVFLGWLTESRKWPTHYDIGQPGIREVTCVPLYILKG